MSPPGQDNRQRRHSMKTVVLARDLYAEGWTPTQIVRHLGEQGIPVALFTVRTWVVPGVADEHRARNSASRLRRQANRRDPERLLRRMQQLSNDVGLGPGPIAKLVGYEFRMTMSADQVGYYLRSGRVPRVPVRHAA